MNNLDQERLREFSRKYIEDNFWPVKPSRTQRNEVHFACPFCGKKDKEGHYYFNLDKCCGFCRRQCTPGMSIFDILREYGRWTDEQIKELLKDLGYKFTPGSIDRQIEDVRKKLNDEYLGLVAEYQSACLNIPVPSDSTLLRPDYYSTYLQKRGVSPRLLADLNLDIYFGGTYRWMGQDDQGNLVELKKDLSNKIVVPIVSDRHRSFLVYNPYPDDWNPKVWYPAVDPSCPDVVTTDLLFLYEQFKHGKSIVLVEGFFDAMRLASYGYPAVALLGNKISVYQCSLLNRCLNLNEVILSLDHDTQFKREKESSTAESRALDKLISFMTCRVSVVRIAHDDPDKNGREEYQEKFISREIVKI